MTGRKQVWLLSGSQALYREVILAQVANRGRGVSDDLDASPNVGTAAVAKPAPTSAHAIRRIILEANADNN